MFDTVTDEALRLRMRLAPRAEALEDAARRTSRVCGVCKRAIEVGEPLFFVGRDVHCAQCHGMLIYELEKERERGAKAKAHGTKWETRLQPDDDGSVGGFSQEGDEG